MLSQADKIERTNLSIAINRLLTEMDTYGPDSPEYPALVAHLKTLTKIRKAKPSYRVDPNTMALVAGNLLGILVIVAYEQKHVMVSKAKDLLLKAH